MIRPMEHAEAHERLADLALEPGAIDRLGRPEDDPLAAHLVTCDDCRRDAGAWRRTATAIGVALGTPGNRVTLAELAADEPIAPPVSLRSAVLAITREPAAPEPEPAHPRDPRREAPAAGIAAARHRMSIRLDRGHRPRHAWQWLGLVAVAVVLLAGGSFVVGQSSRLDAVDRQTARLEAAAATLDRVLQAPEHRVVALVAADGTASGTISWSSHDLVVLTTALAPPPDGKIYRCWIDRGGERSAVGQMWFAGATAFWSGSLADWATTSLDGGGTFGVSLEPASASAGGPAVLSADLGTYSKDQ